MLAQTNKTINNDHKMNGWMDGWMSVTNDDDDDANKKNDRRTCEERRKHTTEGYNNRGSS